MRAGNLIVNRTGMPYAYAADDPVNEGDPVGLWGWNPISDITQAASDVAHHWKTAAAVVGVAAAAASVVVTAGADIPVLAAAATATEGLDAASLAAGATDFSAICGSAVLQGYAATATTASLGAGVVGTAGACVPVLGGSFGGACVWAAATLGLGGIASRFAGLVASIIGFESTLPASPYAWLASVGTACRIYR